jgi:hypothetical protein
MNIDHDDELNAPIPAGGELPWTASAWCGKAGHERSILRAEHWGALTWLLSQWLCPVCRRRTI